MRAAGRNDDSSPSPLFSYQGVKPLPITLTTLPTNANTNATHKHKHTQDPQHPGLIHARDFGYLKQEDDWYILAADPKRSVSSVSAIMYGMECNSGISIQWTTPRNVIRSIPSRAPPVQSYQRKANHKPAQTNKGSRPPPSNLAPNTNQPKNTHTATCSCGTAAATRPGADTRAAWSTPARPRSRPRPCPPSRRWVGGSWF
jgi:hypothetical protein